MKQVTTKTKTFMYYRWEEHASRCEVEEGEGGDDDDGVIVVDVMDRVGSSEEEGLGDFGHVK